MIKDKSLLEEALEWSERLEVAKLKLQATIEREKAKLNDIYYDLRPQLQTTFGHIMINEGLDKAIEHARYITQQRIDLICSQHREDRKVLEDGQFCASHGIWLMRRHRFDFLGMMKWYRL